MSFFPVNKISTYFLPRTQDIQGRIGGLEALKAICAFMVVSLHAHSVIRDFIYPVCIIAVPIFFMISGYFLLYEVGEKTEIRLRKSCYKIIKLYLLSSTIYFAWNLTGLSVQHGEDFYNTGFTVFIYDLLFNGLGQSLHLWYLTTCIYTFLLLIILLRFHIFKYVYIIAAIGLFLNIFVDHYDFQTWTNDPFRYFFLLRNIFLQGVPYMIIGALCHQYENFFTLRNSSLLVILSFCLLFIQQIIPNIPFKLYPLPLAVSILMWFRNIASHGSILRFMAHIGHRYSLGIYLWHLLICDIISHICILLIGGIPLSCMLFITFISTIGIIFIFRQLRVIIPVLKIQKDNR